MITNTDFTGGATEEAGLFEELMRTVGSHTQSQLDSGNITDQNYSTVYLGAMQSAMQIASQFVLSKEHANQQVLLMQAQIIGQEKQNLLIDAQITKMTADTLLSTKQLDLLTAQEDHTIQQTAKAVQDTVYTSKQVEMGTEQILVMKANVLQNTAQTSLIEQQEQNVLAEKANIAKAGLKLDAEKGLLTQKGVTETAQTTGTMTDGVSSIGGILGAQAELYAKQKDGYDRDAEQKATKIYADFFNLVRSTDPDVWPSKYGANGVNCMDVFDVLRSGIGVGATDRTVVDDVTTA